MNYSEPRCDDMRLMSMLENPQTRINGVSISYYFICKTKLWLFLHWIVMEEESDDVLAGRIIDKIRYKRHKKGIGISSNAVIDFVSSGETLEIHDVKKSSKMERAHIFQMAYYLWILKQKGIKAKGFINYPEEQSRRVVILDDDLELELLSAIKEIVSISEGEMPRPERKKYCGKCAYSDFCWADSDET